MRFRARRDALRYVTAVIFPWFSAKSIRDRQCEHDRAEHAEFVRGREGREAGRERTFLALPITRCLSRSHVRLSTYGFAAGPGRRVTALPEIVTGQRDVSRVVSAAAQHEPARRGLGLAPGVVVTRPDLLAAHLEVAAAADHGVLVLAVLVQVAVVVTHVVTAGGLHHLDWKKFESKRRYGDYPT